MTVPLRTTSWEKKLLALAHEAAQDSANLTASIRRTALHTSDAALDDAYDACKTITAHHSKTFYTASSMMPPAKQRAIHALYAFCRVSDDIVDRREGDRMAYLQDWRRRALSNTPPAGDPVALAWHDTRTTYRIPWRYADQLLEGVARDLTTTRYETFDDLATYCYGVASTVGLMAMHITGFDAEATPYAVKLGVALQLTNILRDVAEDWEKGRLYLPLDELAAFGLDEGDIAAGRSDSRWRRFLAYQIGRTRQLYDEAMPGIKMLHRDGRFAVAAAAELYRAILDDIEAHDGDVFSRRAHLTRWGKLRRLPGIWWRSLIGAYG
jgi:phytoene synthase